MKTILTRLSQPQVDAIRVRFPKSLKARAIIIKGSTVTFQVPDGAQRWNASPLHVFDALAASENNASTSKLKSLLSRLEVVILGGKHRDVRVEDEPAADLLEELGSIEKTVSGLLRTGNRRKVDPPKPADLR